MRTQPVRIISGLGAQAGILILTAAMAGCADSQDTHSPPAKSEEPRPLADQEMWDVYSIQGSRVGYGSTRITTVEKNGVQQLQIQGANRMHVKRFGQEAKQEITFESLETPDGRLLEFTSQLSQGTVPLSVAGRVAGSLLHLTTTSAGKSISSTIPWGDAFGGPFAPELSLLQSPMKPGEHRKLRHLALGFNQVATVDLIAKDYEPVEMLHGTSELLRIDTVMRFGDGEVLQGITWTNRTGQVQKTTTAAMGITTYRVSKEVALDQAGPGEFDLGADLTVPLSQPIPNAHGTRAIRYRVHLDEEDPARIFVSGPTQRIRPLDAHTAELTVYALRPDGEVGNPDAASPPATPADLEPTNLVQSDAPTVVAMAEEGAGGQTDPWKTALALEQYVHRTIRLKNFSQAFATAAEVAQTREGDCTEHAVLLAALCRARGIPARAAIGLVYMEADRAFGYHMWNEIYVNDRWIPIDATLARGGIGAAHLKLAHSSLEGAGAYTSFLPVMQVTGRLKIEVEEVE